MKRFLVWAKPVVFLLGLLPLALLLWNAFTGSLSANPVDDFTDTTGRWTLRLLMITLSLTPLRRLTGWSAWIRFRRMSGLFAFFYGILHISVYVVLDHYFDVGAMLRDIADRPFITAGFTALATMTPLALTSTRGWIRRLGGRRWQRLHRLVYVSAAAGVLHYFWNDKLVSPDPLGYALVLAVLLGFRLALYWKRKRPAADQLVR